MTKIEEKRLEIIEYAILNQDRTTEGLEQKLIELEKLVNKTNDIHDVSQCDEKICWWRDRDSKHEECDHCIGECNWHGG